VAEGKERASELGASILSINIVVSVDKFASRNTVAHGLAGVDSVNKTERHVVISLNSGGDVAEGLSVSIGRGGGRSRSGARRSGARRGGLGRRGSVLRGCMRRLGGRGCVRALDRVGEVLQDPANNSCEARVLGVLARVVSVVPTRLSAVPGRVRRAVMVLLSQVKANDIVETESKGLSGDTSGGSKDGGGGDYGRETHGYS